MTEYYKILGLETNATLEEVKTAYRKLSKKFHPDLNEGDKYFEERFKEIQKAYEKIILDRKEKENSSSKFEEHSVKDEELKSEKNNGKRNYAKFFIPIGILFLISILKPIIQKSIRENEQENLIKSYDNSNSYQTKQNDYNDIVDTTAFIPNQKEINKSNDSIATIEKIDIKNRPSLNESTNWLVTKLNGLNLDYYNNSEPSLYYSPTKSRYYNYYFSISENNLYVTYNSDFSEIKIDDETRRNYRNIDISEDNLKSLAGKMTITRSNKYKIIIPLKKITDIYFKDDKDYSGNCHFSLSTSKNDMATLNLDDNSKNYSSYFSFKFDCSQVENLGQRMNDAFENIKYLIPNSSKTSNETF